MVRRYLRGPLKDAESQPTYCTRQLKIRGPRPDAPKVDGPRDLASTRPVLLGMPMETLGPRENFDASAFGA